MPHIHDKIDFTAEVFIVFKNKVLLRKHDKYKKWLSIGGHVELNEDPNETAVREAKEEVGLDIELNESLRKFIQKDETTELIPPYFMNRHGISKTHEHVTLIYFATSNTNVLSENAEKEKSEECRWFTKEEVIKNDEILPNIKFYALKALEKLSV